jgi:hypothetical protein
LAVNCYYLENQLYQDSTPVVDRLYGSRYASAVIDGDDEFNRSFADPDQRSSTAKTFAEMTPSFSEAVSNNSIYFTGTTNLRAGWNFDNVWTIDGSNSGLPVLKMPQVNLTISGKLSTTNGDGTGNVRVIYTIDGGPAQRTTSDANGQFFVAAPVGKMITITKFEFRGQAVKDYQPTAYVTSTTVHHTLVPADLGPVTAGIAIGTVAIAGAVGLMIYFRKD